MADVHSEETRSFNMSRIRSKNTKPELLVRKYLYTSGLRFRLHVKNLPGKPDIVLPKYKTAIFVNGCFWHGHENCKYFSIPKTRTDWWEQKIDMTKLRDLANIKHLTELNWKIITIFGCELKSNRVSDTLANLIKDIKRTALSE